MHVMHEANKYQIRSPVVEASRLPSPAGPGKALWADGSHVRIGGPEFEV